MTDLRLIVGCRISCLTLTKVHSLAGMTEKTKSEICYEGCLLPKDMYEEKSCEFNGGREAGSIF